MGWQEPVKTTLGRTGLLVNPAGLGCGGHSQLGRRHGATEAESVALVERAIELGVDFIDTAAVYGTERIVGRAVRGCRDRVVISTKAMPRGPNGPIRAADLIRYAEKSLERLDTDTVDVFHLHGVTASEYAYCRDELVPALQKLREQGKIRFLGITEQFTVDPGHEMLALALPDDVFDVVMVGFNLLNPSARERVLTLTRKGGVATLNMFAVRRALSRPSDLRAVVADLAARGLVSATDVDAADPLGFLAGDGVAGSVVEAAYRFCRHEPGIDVVLTGTGSSEHLEENLRSLARGPLPEPALRRLASLFGELDCVSGN
jgi:L-galactose dehydrogenase